MRRMLAMLCLVPALAAAGDMAPRDGWRVVPTELSHAELLARLTEAVPACRAAGVGVVPLNCTGNCRRPSSTTSSAAVWPTA